MLTSVRGCTHNLEAGGSRKLCELSVMAQVGNGLLRNQIAMVILGLVIVLVIGGVIFPPCGPARGRAGRLPSTFSTASCGGGGYTCRA